MLIINLTDIIFDGMLILATFACAATLLIDHLNSKHHKHKRTERDERLIEAYPE